MLKSHLILNQTKLDYRKLSNKEIQYSKAILHNYKNEIFFNVMFSIHEREACIRIWLLNSLEINF